MIQGLLLKCRICNNKFIVNKSQYEKEILKNKTLVCPYDQSHDENYLEVIGNCLYRINQSEEKKSIEIKECFKNGRVYIRKNGKIIQKQ